METGGLIGGLGRGRGLGRGGRGLGRGGRLPGRFVGRAGRTLSAVLCP